VFAACDEIGGRDPRTPAQVWLYRLALRAGSGVDRASPMSFGIGEG
jgi:hypothetical protein